MFVWKGLNSVSYCRLLPPLYTVVNLYNANILSVSYM